MPTTSVICRPLSDSPAINLGLYVFLYCGISCMLIQVGLIFLWSYNEDLLKNIKGEPVGYSFLIAGVVCFFLFAGLFLYDGYRKKYWRYYYRNMRRILGLNPDSNSRDTRWSANVSGLSSISSISLENVSLNNPARNTPQEIPDTSHRLPVATAESSSFRVLRPRVQTSPVGFEQRPALQSEQQQTSGQELPSLVQSVTDQENLPGVIARDNEIPEHRIRGKKKITPVVSKGVVHGQFEPSLRRSQRLASNQQQQSVTLPGEIPEAGSSPMSSDELRRRRLGYKQPEPSNVTPGANI